MTEERRDYRREVTDSVIKMLEEGTAPWQKPWEDNGTGMPMNPTTGKNYRGGNVMWLMATGMHKGYSDSRWMTYRQAVEKEWQVRKGEKGTQIEFWEVKAGKPEEGADPDEKKSRFIHRVFTVFNAQQIDGIPALEIKKREPWEVCDAGESILKHSGADIRYGGGRAFYRKDGDYIQLPRRECFGDPAGFYGTGCHELSHWSGHPARLNRPTLIESKKFGDEPYSREEIVVEMAAWMIALQTGIPHNPVEHGAYIASWLKALKNDKNEIFKASQEASRAAEFLLGFQKERAKEEPQSQEPVIEEAPSHLERAEASRQPYHRFR